MPDPFSIPKITEIQKFSTLQSNLIIISLLGLDKIEFLQSHENMEIYQKAFDIIEHFFGTEEEDSNLAPAIDQDHQQYQFSSDQSVPMGGFKF